MSKWIKGQVCELTLVEEKSICMNLSEAEKDLETGVKKTLTLNTHFLQGFP